MKIALRTLPIFGLALMATLTAHAQTPVDDRHQSIQDSISPHHRHL